MVAAADPDRAAAAELADAALDDGAGAVHLHAVLRPVYVWATGRRSIGVIRQAAAPSSMPMCIRCHGGWHGTFRPQAFPMPAVGTANAGFGATLPHNVGRAQKGVGCRKRL